MLKSAPDLAIAALYVLPGFIASYVRALFVPPRTESTSDRLLSYVAITGAYFFIVAPFYPEIVSDSEFDEADYMAWLGYTVIWPCLIGIGLGLNERLGWVRDCL
ncbi:MAG: DUF6338 family protein [Pikeienuella sp.]